MNKMPVTLFGFIGLILVYSQVNAANANSDYLMLDTHVINTEIINFPNDNEIYPDKSDFKIIHLVTMSNELGDRYATVTLKNLSTGRRIFKQNHIMALFADGSRLSPAIAEAVVDGKESVSITLYFGEHKFPILTLYTRG